jgi:DMSO/TMAO reductase YedYZ molybdopterin-dependent catalytic subunit
MIRGGMGAVAAALANVPLSVFGIVDADDGEPIPFLDADKVAAKGAATDWNELKDWLSPSNKIYHVSHYGVAQVKAEGWKLSVGGLVEKPITLTLDEIKARPKREAIVTIECGGNGNPGFMGAVGNAKWTGTPLAPLLKECGMKEDAVEVAFWGTDTGKEKIRNNEVTQHFARALSVKNAMRDDVLLCYEMNDQPLTQGHGFPLRLVVPGWFGIAWVKWLREIEVRDRALMTRFMAKDYVTLRGEQHGNDIVWKETSVGPMNIKSIAARAFRRKDGTVRISGAAWGGGTEPKAVEVQIDGGQWMAARIDDSHKEPYTWRFWTFDWKDVKPGEHTIVSRAVDAKGRVQPSENDPAMKLKKTFWEANAQYPRRIKI